MSIRIFTEDELFTCLCACYSSESCHLNYGAAKGDFIEDLPAHLAWEIKALPEDAQTRFRALVKRIVHNNMGAFEKYYNRPACDIGDNEEQWERAIYCLIPALEEFIKEE